MSEFGVATVSNAEDFAHWFIFRDENLLLVDDEQGAKIPQFVLPRDFKCQASRIISMGTWESLPCFCMETKIADDHLPNSMSFYPLRQALIALGEEEKNLKVSLARQLLHWDAITQFCGRCGRATTHHAVERAKQCDACRQLMYPPISPVMMVLIWKRSKEILLARSTHFTKGVYSVLAGFVEPGERLEQAVHREVFEEVGLKIKNLVYFDSQPWPFPSNLMLGFMAEYESGEIAIETKELEDARWFSMDNLPDLPKSMSLSRLLINAFLSRSNDVNG